MKIAIAWALVLIVISIAVLPHSFANAASDPNAKAKTTITNSIDKAVNGQWKGICQDAITTGFNQTLKIVYDKNNTRCNGIIPTPPVPPLPPVPVPPPTGNATKIALVGDISGISVRDSIKKSNPNLVVLLGDLGYKSDLSSIKKDWGGSFKNLKCVIGNHDSPEDGGSSIYKEALAYCGDHWSLKIGNSTLILGFNTNGDMSAQLTYAKSILSQNPTMKTVILLSHKGGHVPPSSHHPAEAKTFYQQIETTISPSMKLFEIYGHNHVSSAAPSKNWYQS
jgi:predicted phosphodiesterase